VLYLDSDHLIVRFMERLGEQRGFHLRGFTSAEEALHALKLEPQSFNLMIVNSEMRSLRGVQIIAAAREVSSSLPIYLASAYIDESLLNQAREATATDVVFKNDIEGLVALIAKHDR
jgi:DNA-binding response OmpR family regulator